MLNELQRDIFSEITQDCTINLSGVDQLTVEQTPDYLKCPVRMHDTATAFCAALGLGIEALGRERGLPQQQLEIDRRHAGVALNSTMMHFQNGWALARIYTVQATCQIYPDKNGEWILFNGEYMHFRRGILRYLDCADHPAAIEAATRKLTVQRMEDDCAELALPAAIVRTRDEWSRHPQGEFVATTPPVAIQQIGSAARKPLPPAKARPLEGVRVLSLAHVIAGPLAGRLMAEHGADVIELRHPDFPKHTTFETDTGYGKRSMWANLTLSECKAKFEELLSGCDVLVWGYRTGGLERLGYPMEKLLEINPHLIICRVNAYGFGGPWEPRRGWEQNAQATTGCVTESSPPDEPALMPALGCDYGTGFLGALGVVDALARRSSQGGAWEVRVCLARTGMLFASHTDPKAVAVPLTNADFEKYFVDQETPEGIFTHVAPVARFSLTPAMTPGLSVGMLGSTPMTASWHDEVPDTLPPVPHYPSKIAREGGLRGVDAPYGKPFSSACGKQSLPSDYARENW
jgi:hypothetical protein